MNANDSRVFTPGEFYPRKGLFIICPNCEDELFGRRNQKFCDPKCKSEYHNQRRNELSSHQTLSELKEADRSLALLYKKFGSDSVSEVVLDAFGILTNGAIKEMDTDSLKIAGYLNYALAIDPKTNSHSIITIREAENLGMESFERLLATL